MGTPIILSYSPAELDEEQQHQFDPVTFLDGNAYHIVFRFDHRN